MRAACAGNLRGKRGFGGGRRVPPALLLAAILLAGAVSLSIAGGPRAVNGLGQPMAWDTTAPVVYHPDTGPLGLLTNAQARALLAEAFAAWEDGPAFITFSEGTLLPFDVDATGFAFTNPAHYRNFYRVDGDGKSPVIFDHDGSIIESVFGIGARFEILGVAGLDVPITADTEITGASIIINGAFYDGVGLPNSPEDVSLQGLKAAMVHEIGHFINLDHTMLNHEQALDDVAGNDIYVPTMFPMAVQDEAALASINPDDELASVNLYGPGVIPESTKIGGGVTAGGVPFQGANVVLRRTDDPLMAAYSLISGGRFFPCNPGSICDPCTTACDPGNPPEKGSFAAMFFGSGLYEVCVEQIDTRFSVANDTFVGPLATPPILPGPEECHDAAEGATQTDDPDEVTSVIPSSSGITNIVLNALPLSDPFELNNTLGSGAVLDDLPAGRDTAPGILGTGDLDVFEVPVTAGQRVRIDIDAAELGSTLDAVAGFYDASNNLVALSDDAVDLDSQAFSTDPALELIASFTGTGKVVVSSFPDLDQNGAGGGTTGAYWIRVEVTTDTDLDGTQDNDDVCPSDDRDDADRDGFCFDFDNCPTVPNPLQSVLTKLNPTLVSGGAVSDFFISPDGANVVYLADKDTNEVLELYSVAIEGGASTKLNSALVSGGDVRSWAFSPDGSIVVYKADQDTDGVLELFSVPIGGGSPTQLNGAFVSGGSLTTFGDFAISPDGTKVIYVADQDTDEVKELYVVPIAGGPSTKLNGALLPTEDINGSLFSPNSATVLYRRVGTGIDLYSVPATGGASTQLNTPGNSANPNIFVSPNSATVVFNNFAGVYSVPIGGGAQTTLTGTLTPGGSIQGYTMSSDGSRVVFMADKDTDQVFELYSAPIVGGSITKLNAPLVPGGDVTTWLTPDGSTDVVYVADKDADELLELFRVPQGGGASTQLNAPLVSGGDVQFVWSSADGTVIHYTADQDTDEVFDLYTVPVGGGTPTRVNGPMTAGGGIWTWDRSPVDSDTIAYVADQDADEVFELYSVTTLGGTPIKLNAPIVTGGNVAWSYFSPDGSRVVFLADQDLDTVDELYSVGTATGADTDNDGILNRCDLCLAVADPAQTDSDGNGLGDACQSCGLGTDPDADNDCGTADNCPTVANANQADFDADGAGNACDADDDNDGLADVVETNTGTFVNSADTGTDPLDADSDNDGVEDGAEVDAGSDPTNSVRPLRVHFGPQQTISTSAAGAYSLHAADLDGDGDVDLLSASVLDDKIAWYENTDGEGTFGSQQVITSFADGATSVFAADIDGDGDLDVLSASGEDSTIAWYENTDGAGTFGAEQVITIEAYGAYAVFAADIDGDGRVDVLSASTNDNEVAWYRNTDGLGSFSTLQLISTTARGATSVFAADLDGDTDLDVLAASSYDLDFTWYENTDGAGTFGPEQVISNQQAGGAWRISAADMDGDGDRDVLSAAWGDDKLRWHENDGTPGGLGDWAIHEIRAPGDGEGGDAIAATDMDGDGDQDVLAMIASKLVWYENVSAGTFGPLQMIFPVNNYSSDAAIAADVDGDGDMDVLSAAANNLDPSNTIAWYENRSIHRNMSFTTRQTVSSVATDLGTYDVTAADIDRDGDLDAITAASSADRISWHENEGGSPIVWTTRVLPGIVNGPEQIGAVDLDRDGDVDIVSVSFEDDTVAWHENDGASPPGWTMRTISTSGDGVWGLAVADFDGDGDSDVAAASWLDAEVSWYENDGTPADGGWIERSISVATPTSQSKKGLAAADLDSDGDIDLLAAEVSANRIRWYRNDGNVPPAWSEGTLSSGGTPGSPNYVTVADLNGDGHLDVVTGGYASNNLAWYEHDGNASPTWTLHFIPTNANGWTDVKAVDLDMDGDTDIISPSLLTDQVRTWDNSGAAVPAWTERTLPGPAGFARATFPADVDGDGDVDLLAAMFAPREVVFYENRGGQFSLATALSAPAGMPDGTTAEMLRIDLTSRGRAGDSAVELANLTLGVTDGTGASLSSDEANALIERLRIHLDDGSGVFEAASDLPVATVQTLALSPQVIEFAHGDPRVRVAAGVTKRFFVVVQTTRNASAHSPSSFRLVHQTESGSSARDAETGILLNLQDPADSSTSTIASTGDALAPAVATVFPADNAVDVSLSTSVVLYFSEAVDPASAATGVALYEGGLKVSGRVTVNGPVVSIDPDSSLLVSTDYLVRVTPALLDRSGNPAVPFVSTFDTTDSPFASDIGAGETGGGATLGGSNADDNSGFAAAALGDVNDTLANNGIADLIIGAPNADADATDAGKATLVFGAPGLQSNTAAILRLVYRTGTAQDFIGETVAQAGDVNGDTVRDFLIGAPRSDQAHTDAGVVYLVFGDPGLDELAPATLDLDNLATCAAPTLCGVKFLGAAAGDLAGAALSWAGDVNGDGADDIVIGAPGASPGGRTAAGRVYLVYGPLAPGTIQLSQVGSSVPGLTFNGETAGDNFGAAVSPWPDRTGDGFDDLLIGAPAGTSLDVHGVPIPGAGYVYAIQGGVGPGHLDDTATPGVIEMARVANGAANQVAGMVFLGDREDGNIGRSLTGAVDIDGNGVYDILIAGNGVAFVIPGDGPKTIVGSTPTGGTGGGGALRSGVFTAIRDFDAVMYVTGDDNPLIVASAGDINNDGFDDFIIGNPLFDSLADIDVGRAYILLGNPAPGSGVKLLDDVGDAIAGFVVSGNEAGDNLGASVGGGFDLNADGVDDGLVGAPFADSSPSTPPDAGETYVISPLRPGEVLALSVSHPGGSTARLEWSVPDLAATYNVYRGLLSALQIAGVARTSNMTQLACGTPDDSDADMLPDHDDADMPPAGNAWFYLVTAENYQGEGPLGPAGAIPTRINDMQCP